MAVRPARSRRRGCAGSTGPSRGRRRPSGRRRTGPAPRSCRRPWSGRRRARRSGRRRGRAPRRRRGRDSADGRGCAPIWPRVRRGRRASRSCRRRSTCTRRRRARRCRAIGASPRADVDDVRVGLGDRDRADRAGPEAAVGDGLPVAPAVGRLPDAAAGRAEVEGARLAGHARDRRDAAAAEGTDRPELEPLELVGEARRLRFLRSRRRLREGARSHESGSERERGQATSNDSHGSPFGITNRSNRSRKYTWGQVSQSVSFLSSS